MPKNQIVERVARRAFGAAVVWAHANVVSKVLRATAYACALDAPGT